MWFSTLRTPSSSRRALLNTVLALASLQQVYARSQPHDIEEEGTVKRWEGLNLSLKTSWKAGPYILEILECGALEKEEFYFKLLELIGSETIKIEESEQKMYETVVQYVEKNELLDHRYIPTWKFCISIREPTPRIEAQYQYYRNNIDFPKGDSCPVWFDDGERQSCKPEDLANVKPQSNSASRNKQIAFDRSKSDDDRKGLVTFYIDVIDKGFPKAYSDMVQAAEKAGIAYKLRYKPSPGLKNPKPVALSGYGVSLALKKTDYLVIDDRGAKEDAKDGSAESSSASSASSATPSPTYKFKTPKNLKAKEKRFPLWDLEDIDDPVRDLRDLLPLSQTNLGDLGFKTANFVSKSGIYPPDMLLKILSDFPKYAHTIGTMGGVLKEFRDEHDENRENFMPAGFNAMIINGMLLEPSEVTATTLLEILRRERHHTLQIQALGLNPKEALDLVTHEDIAEGKINEDKPRFDYREKEGEEGAIIWFNDFETDESYQDWPESITEIMMPTYGGQLASIRKNIHTLVIPLDFSNRDDLVLIAERLMFFVKRGLALRIGVVPVVRNNLGSTNARVFAALLDSYDLITAVNYLKDGLEADKYHVRHPAPEYIHHAIKNRILKEGKDVPSLSSVMESKVYQVRAQAAGAWESRLGVISKPYPFFMNGIGHTFGDDWIQIVSSTLPNDVKRMQEAVSEGTLTDLVDVQDFLLNDPSLKRNPLIFPDGDHKMVNMFDLFETAPETFDNLPHFPGKLVEEDETSSADVWVIGDFDTESGYNLLAEAAKIQNEKPGISITAVSNTGDSTNLQTVSVLLHSLTKNIEVMRKPGLLQKIIEEVKPEKDFVDMQIDGQKVLGDDAKTSGWAIPDKLAADKFWRETASLVHRKLGIKPGQKAVIVNGRVLGPFGNEINWTRDDFDTLIKAELKGRITPVLKAAKKMGVLDRFRAANYKAKLTSSLNILLNPPNTGLADRSTNFRTNRYEQWKRSKTCLSAGDPVWSTFRIVVSLDPLSETGQKWAPILRALMAMDGVGIYTFLNPKDIISEVPIKRYYRHVLYPQPKFDENGDILEPKAQFIGLPDQTLYSLSLDVPPSWLVTPSETIHDLDNIKLSTFKQQFGTSDLNATYVLRNILIEGHSRDTSLNEPSAGAQLELGTPQNPVMEDTLIMQNLGYFQFKSNPGHWQIRLKPGRSSDVFSIQSLGHSGFSRADDAEDDVKDLTLMSFRGVTLFPRLKRNKGYMGVDVFAQDEPETVVEKAAGFADGLLSKIGLGKAKKDSKEVAKPHAEINIFSVASGHLYERFLNIMMVSVMRHTKHTVKFWFIENFLSPAFKDFIPIMAKEYGFEYELVTYKWPHWLRPQKEKQREIWGYKILFLDVLFPLSLQKIIFVDADQIVRTDMKELVDLDLNGSVYGFTPMCDSRKEIEGYRFWKTGYWKTFLGDLKYHISALFVVDLKMFRQLAGGDRLRQQYHQLSADPNSLSNLDQDLPNNMQRFLPIYSLPQDWLWCETWCDDESFKTAKTIDLCNNPMTKEPKLDRARRQIPEWTEYDDEVAALAKKVQAKGMENMREALVQKEALGEQEKAGKEEKTERKEGKEEKTETEAEKAVPPKDEL